MTSVVCGMTGVKRETVSVEARAGNAAAAAKAPEVRRNSRRDRISPKVREGAS
jgi:hypothetical protein